MTRTIRTASALALIVLLLASAGCVRVELNDSGPSGSSVTEKVELQGAKRVDATIELGAGEGTLLGGLDLENLTVQMGVGDTTIDLVGAATHDLDATIEGGVGDVNVETVD